LKKSKFKISSWFAVLSVFIPLFAVAFTVVGGGANLSLFGKSGSSGRKEIWEYILENMYTNKDFLLFGKGKYLINYSNGIFENAHNAYMQIICNFGIVVFMVILVCLIAMSISAAKRVTDRYTFVAFAGILAILINNSFETHIADSIIGMTFMWIVLYWILISRGQK
jgi:hypothetical protein